MELESADIEETVAPGFLVKSCPKCGAPQRIPSDKLRQAVQCTECNFWGIIS